MTDQAQDASILIGDRRRPTFSDRPLTVQIFVLALGLVLVGYMFMGRGFAHIGIGPIFIGDVVLVIGVVAAGLALIRRRADPQLTLTIALVLAFMVLGAIRTIPYIGTYGLDALRDGTLWGYAAFALIVSLLADRALLDGAFRIYGWIVPVFALWLPICWNIFAAASAGINGSTPGAFIPLVFFKGGDMAVHVVGSIAFLILGASAVVSLRAFVWRVVVGLPLLWTVFVAGTSNRGALVTAIVGIATVGVIGGRRRNWRPLVVAAVVLLVGVTLQGTLLQPAPDGASNRAQLPRTASVTGSPGSSVARSPGTTAPTAADPSAPTTGTSSPFSPSAGPGPTPIALPGRAVDVPNAGFEAAKVNRRIPAWQFFGVGTFDLRSGGAFDGTQFGVMDNTGSAYQARVTSAPIPFATGPDIAVGAWVKAMSGQPTVELYVNWLDTSGNQIASQFVRAIGPATDASWHLVTGFLKVPADTASIQVRLWMAAPHASVGIDDVMVAAGDYGLTPPPSKGRPATINQVIENILSVFGSSSDQGLEGTKQFRLAWWGTIVDYTVFGKYFWTGKGFGINLADSDGFQATADHSLRAPHNSHMTVLAREGVPGLILWILLQGAFAIGLIRAIVLARRAGDSRLAILGGWLLAYWVAIMVDTSFDPYLEGPQGGIWFWVIIGAGLVVIRLAPRARPAE